MVQNLEIVAQFSTKLAQFFGTILKQKFEVEVLASPKAPPSQHSAKMLMVQNLEIAAQFSTKLEQSFDTIFKSKFAIEDGAGEMYLFTT